MSYILDALRKADAQRQRTRLPGLHAQSPSVAPSVSSDAWWRSPITWALGSALAILALVLAWPGPQAPVIVATPTTAAMQEPAPAPAPAAAPSPALAPEPAAPVATAIQPAPAPAVPERRAPPRAMRSTPDRAAAPQPREPSAPPPVPAAATAPAPAPAAASAAAPAAAEPGSTPAGAPKLAITGGVYSANASQRLLIVGGQVFNEGSEVAPGVVLEQVRPNQALLNFQGQRYTVRY